MMALLCKIQEKDEYSWMLNLIYLVVLIIFFKFFNEIVKCFPDNDVIVRLLHKDFVSTPTAMNSTMHNFSHDFFPAAFLRTFVWSIGEVPRLEGNNKGRGVKCDKSCA